MDRFLSGWHEPGAIAELAQRVARDQRARAYFARLLATSKRTGAPTDEQLEELRKVDRENTDWLEDRVEQGGWPLRSEVGDDGCLNAWLLVQHADHDPAFQRRCLDLMLAAPEGQVDPAQLAYLCDRVMLAEGKPQLYGTQLETVDGRFQPRDLADPAEVDIRRLGVGLPPLSEYLALFENPKG